MVHPYHEEKRKEKKLKDKSKDKKNEGRTKFHHVVLWEVLEIASLHPHEIFYLKKCSFVR